ncbi:MAG: HlyD family efflux transporter periplasmic adaptor subunit [Planctomycetia bacterium]|nr:HlyD family efflux transporter periplasmic adaptor subunit [Planctomycetia bacterium]
MKRINKISYCLTFIGSILILFAGSALIFAAKGEEKAPVNPAANKPVPTANKPDPASQKPVLLKKEEKGQVQETVKSPEQGKTVSNKTEQPKEIQKQKTVDEPVLNSPQRAIEWAVSDWRKSSKAVDPYRAGRKALSEVPYSVSRYQAPGASAPFPTGAVPINKAERDRFITQEPQFLPGSKHPIGSGTPIPGAPVMGTPAGAPAMGSQNPAPNVPMQKTTVYGDFAPDNVQLGPNDILVQDSIVEIPKGEGYEALISANGQGLLVELGAEVLDKDGKPVLDKDGKTKRIPFKRGMKVRKGQILGKQNDREHAANRLVAEQQLIVAKKEAEKQLEVEVARLAVQVAQSEYLRVEQANQKMAGAVPAEEVVQRAYEWKRADKAAEKAVYDLGVKSDEVEVRKAQVVAADAQVLDRKLVSPIDGFIDDIMQDEGQWLREGDNILKIIRLDKVQICGKIDANVYSPEMVDGKKVTVYVKKPGSSVKKVEGNIIYARQIVESGKFYIYAEVENLCNEQGYWQLNPGTIVTMVVHR